MSAVEPSVGPEATLLGAVGAGGGGSSCWDCSGTVNVTAKAVELPIYANTAAPNNSMFYDSIDDAVGWKDNAGVFHPFHIGGATPKS